MVEGGYQFGTQFKSKIRFDQLDPSFNTVKIRAKLFSQALIGTVFFIIVAIVVGYFRKVNLDDFWFLLAAMLPLSTIVICLCSCKRIEYAQFKNETGIVILDLGKTGPDKASFEKFVKQIQDNILLAKNADD